MLGSRGPRRPADPQAGRGGAWEKPLREAQASRSAGEAGRPLPGRPQRRPRGWTGSRCPQSGPVLTKQERQTERARRRAWAEEGSKARTRDSGLVLERVVGQGADDGWLGLRDTRFHIGNSFNKHLSRAHNTPGPVLSAGSSLGPSPGQPPLRGCRRNVDSQPWAPCLWGDGGVTCAGGGETGQPPPPPGAGETPMGGA